MSIILIAIGSFILFLPLIYVMAHETGDHKRMRARFAMLHTGGAGGLSSSKETQLLKEVSHEQTSALTKAAERCSRWLGFEQLLLQAGSTRSPLGLLRLCSISSIVTFFVVLMATHQLWAAVLGGGLGGAAPCSQLRLRSNRRTTAMEKALPQVMDMISRALRAGHSLPAALGIVAEEASEPARSAFSGVYQKQRFGLPMRDALLDLIRSFPSQDLKVLVTAILVQRDTGGNLVQILDRTSTVIRDRLKLQGDVRVHTAQGRMTGWVLCLLPVGMLGVLMVTNPSYPKALLEDPLGRKLVYVAIFLLGFGAYLIGRIVKGIEV